MMLHLYYLLHTLTMLRCLAKANETTTVRNQMPNHSLRYIFGPEEMGLLEASNFCRKWKGFIVRDVKPVLLDLMGLPGRPFWYNGSRILNGYFNVLPMLTSMGSRFTSRVDRRCNVFRGYGIIAPVPCHFRALPWCEISVIGQRELQRTHPKKWVRMA
ncbi:unnamed protein product [Dicrocoelium dendriticum]|nr:unnamed protein product [Dicrocoelium dendriticum]